MLILTKKKEDELYIKQIKEIIWAIKEARVISSSTNYDIQVNFKKLNTDIRGKMKTPLMRKNTLRK